MLTSNGTSAEMEARQTKELLKALKKFGPFLTGQATAGCTIALFMKEYIARVLQSDPTDNTILNISSPVWTGRGIAEGFLIDEFTLVSRLLNNSGNFLSIRRVIKEDVKWCRRHTLAISNEFHKTVKERIKYKTLERDISLLVLGDNLRAIMLMSKKLVSFKVDGGMHLVFKEKPRTNRYIEVYLGGWMDEVRFPLEDYQANRVVNQLRQV